MHADAHAGSPLQLTYPSCNMITKYEIPKGRTKEKIQAREKIINEFFANWMSVNPEKRIYNAHLHEFIYLDYFPFQETACKAARSYKTTLAVIYLTEILELAKATIWSSLKESGEIPIRFTNRIIMPYEKPCFGKINLTVGAVHQKGKKSKFYLTAIEKNDVER